MWQVYTKSPPQVVAVATHTSFPIWQEIRPRDGFFMYFLTFDHASIAEGLGHTIKLLV